MRSYRGGLRVLSLRTLRLPTADARAWGRMRRAALGTLLLETSGIGRDGTTPGHFTRIEPLYWILGPKLLSFPSTILLGSIPTSAC